MSGVAGQDPETMTDSGGGDQSIGDGYLLACQPGTRSDLSPDVTCFHTDRQGALGDLALRFLQPPLQDGSFPTGGKVRRHLTHPAKGENAQERLVDMPPFHRVTNSPIRMRTIEFRDNACIERNAHTSHHAGDFNRVRDRRLRNWKHSSSNRQMRAFRQSGDRTFLRQECRRFALSATCVVGRH